jgi:hypothetical protein
MRKQPRLPKRFQPKKFSLAPWVWVLAVAMPALAFAYFAGVYWGAPLSLRAAAQNKRLEHAFSAQSADNAHLRTREAFLDQSLALSKQSEAATRKALIAQRGKMMDLRRKLDFYEGIVTSGASKAAIKIAGLQIIPTRRKREYRFQIVLVHAGGKRGKSISGVCHIVLTGKRHGEEKRLSLAKISPHSAKSMKFTLRYFHNLGGSFRLPAGFTPEKVNISVTTGHDKPDVTSSYNWSAFGG